MIRLRDISNPVIAPEAIIVEGSINAIGPDLLGEFKEYLGIAHDGEDANLRSLLLAKFREISRPTSLGLGMNINTWIMNVELNGCRHVYLPRYNGMNLTAIDYDTSGNVITGVTWGDAPGQRNYAIVTTTAAVLPDVTSFTYTTGFNVDDYPDPVKMMAFMECGFTREFPLGVDDRGQSVPERPAATELTRAEWRMINDLTCEAIL